MKIFLNIALVILVFLAVSSGLTKIMLLEQEVEFFSEYGFNHSILMLFGIVQLVGGILLVLLKTRMVGAIVVAITFLISAVMLILAQSWLITAITFISLVMLGMIIRDCSKSGTRGKQPDANEFA